MTIYILNILLIGVYALIYKFKFSQSKRALKCLLTLSIAQLIALLCLKNIWIGSDMPFYWDYFYKQMPWSIQDLSAIRYELGFKILTKFVTNWTQNKQIYLLVISTVSTIPVGYLAYKYSKKPFLTIFLYVCLGFFAFNFSGLRQAMAIGVTLVSFKYLMESKPIKFILTICLAALFHLSALVFLPAYFVRKVHLTNRRVAALSILAVIVYELKDGILSLINRYFYQSYEIAQTNSYRWMVMCIVMVIVSLFFYNKVVAADERKRVLYNLCIIGAILMLFSPIAANVLRIANYYFIYIILLIPEALDTLKYSRGKSLVLGAVIIASLGIYIYLLGIDGYSTLPYKFLWQ